jgi:uncharacterized membrane protein YebE (DUF533 family)
MGAQSMLEKLLQSGLSAVQGGVPQAGRGGPVGAPGTSGNSGPLNKLGGLGGFAGGAAAGGALALLLGSKSGRRLGGKAVRYGGAAALGALALKAYQQWQENQSRQPVPQPATGTAAAEPVVTPLRESQVIHRLPAPDAEQQSRALLAAMIAAAKADGHVDDAERERIDSALQRLDDDPHLHRFVAEQLRKPLDPAEVAGMASTPELAAEVYLASLLVADETGYMERAYLDELARQLKLPAGLKESLHAQAAG